MLKLNYPEASGGMINASRIFYAFSFKISAKYSYQSMIIPYGILTDTTSTKLRKKIFKENTFINIDAFPERDSISKRVFEDAKMSTAILITSKHKTQRNFNLGISHGKCIELNNRSEFNPCDLMKLNPELFQILLTDVESFQILVKIYSNKFVKKLGSFSACLTGEVDMTFAREVLTDSLTDHKLIKGVQIDRYTEKLKNEFISQGEIKFLDAELFQNIYNGEKLHDTNNTRLVLQGLTGVNEKNRLKEEKKRLIEERKIKKKKKKD